jgi:hypothetical protein
VKQETMADDTTYTCQLRAFVAQIRGGKTFPTNGAQGVIKMRIIDDAYRAAGLPPRGTAVKLFGTKRYRFFHACLCETDERPR